jgi:hypothetical protein
MFKMTLMQAGIENLVECPFCPFVAIMDDPTDLIFACANPECGIHSCRNCRVKSHDPLTCQGISQRRILKANLHRIRGEQAEGQNIIGETCSRRSNDGSIDQQMQ